TAHSPASALGGVAPQGYLVASQGVLLVPTGRSTPAGFDLETGKLLYCNPEVHQHWWPGGTRTTATAGYFFNPCTQGTFSFSHAKSGPADPVLFNGTHVYDIKTGRHASQRFLPFTHYHSNAFYRTLARGEDLFTVEPGWIRRVNMHDPLSRSIRREVWKSEFEGNRAHSMAWIGDHLIVGDENAIHVYEAESGKKIWRADVKGTVRGIASVEGQLILSTEEGEIQCWTPGREKTHSIKEAVPSLNTVSVNPDAEWVLDRLEDGKPHSGFAVVLEDEPDLALQLVRQTKLQVTLIVESNEARDRIQNRLFDDGQNFGHRLTILAKDRLVDLPPYFANVVVSPQHSKMPFRDLHRILHPYSGRWLLPGQDSNIVAETELFEKGPELEWKTTVGGQLGIAGAIPAMHRRVQGPFEMLWFGGPGPMRMSDRHIVNGPRPKAAGGRMFVVGSHDVMAFDAFNGAELWSLPLRDACVRDREVRTSS
ncbi:MAG: PQQ-binding-like beta-propeller repeat protein, partial [Planctomycetaceae bacterium]|nr:PQQ-binding-like beta-propeller repeat protein [Planctomycetaceae bacterium]